MIVTLKLNQWDEMFPSHIDGKPQGESELGRKIRLATRRELTIDKGHMVDANFSVELDPKWGPTMSRELTRLGHTVRDAIDMRYKSHVISYLRSPGCYDVRIGRLTIASRIYSYDFAKKYVDQIVGHKGEE